MRPSFTAMNDR